MLVKYDLQENTCGSGFSVPFWYSFMTDSTENDCTVGGLVTILTFPSHYTILGFVVSDTISVWLLIHRRHQPGPPLTGLFNSYPGMHSTWCVDSNWPNHCPPVDGFQLGADLFHHNNQQKAFSAALARCYSAIFCHFIWCPEPKEVSMLIRQGSHAS